MAAVTQRLGCQLSPAAARLVGWCSPLCGLRILTNFRPGEAPSWYRGFIYNPNDGRTFNSTIHVEEDGTLKVRGFVGVSLFGKTVEWVRPRETLARCS